MKEKLENFEKENEAIKTNEFNEQLTNRIKEAVEEIMKMLRKKTSELEVDDAAKVLIGKRRKLNTKRLKYTVEYAELNKIIRKKIIQPENKKKNQRSNSNIKLTTNTHTYS